MIRIVSAVLLFFGVLSGLAIADEHGSLFPDIPKATGTPHPEGNDFWRLNHMDLLRHDRDSTVHYGERKVTASLKACVDCHAVDGPDATPIGYDNSGHFCRSCHDYVAVKIDCFTCHNSQPQTSASSDLQQQSLNTDGIRAYLAEVEKADILIR